ncbi:hypothetical protein QTO34_006277 [Cnephaeus nilssonii]|uniref:Prothymosin alpha n=1 Tax=Cnephaeus nilssonii TaxID=3371016 RepID=A0AA40HMC3_CNENI|nr:hypothetical protein QTO34_006277 [Eptesicus nilssonii]
MADLGSRLPALTHAACPATTSATRLFRCPASSPESSNSRFLEKIRCMGSSACPTILKEKKEVVEEAENRRDALVNGNANEKNGEQESDNEVDEEEKEGGEKEE